MVINNLKLRNLFTNLIMILVSSIVGILICELGLKLFLNPADYLSVSMINHNILGAVVLPNTRGFDEWGFRNRSKPSHVDIVAIGDSHTYGNTARMDDSWPNVLSRLSGQSVYNMGLGGYGPNQYYYLLKTKALAMHPKVIICGIYMGDDFENAFSITYGKEYWSFLRQERFDGVNPDIWEGTASDAALSWHKRVRLWLSMHSVIYQLTFHGPILGRIKGNIQIDHASRLYDGTVSLILSEKNIKEAFRPGSLVSRLDVKDKRIMEGMRITFVLLKDMAEICAKDNIQFIVVIIPTKEMVFAEYLEHNSNLPQYDVITTLLRNERLARESFLQFLDQSKIHYVDTLLAMQQSVGKELYARTAADMHPSKNGYGIMAGAVFDSLQKIEKEN